MDKLNQSKEITLQDINLEAADKVGDRIQTCFVRHNDDGEVAAMSRSCFRESATSSCSSGTPLSSSAAPIVVVDERSASYERSEANRVLISSFVFPGVRPIDLQPLVAVEWCRLEAPATIAALSRGKVYYGCRADRGLLQTLVPKPFVQLRDFGGWPKRRLGPIVWDGVPRDKSKGGRKLDYLFAFVPPVEPHEYLLFFERYRNDLGGLMAALALPPVPPPISVGPRRVSGTVRELRDDSDDGKCRQSSRSPVVASASPTPNFSPPVVGENEHQCREGVGESTGGDGRSVDRVQRRELVLFSNPVRSGAHVVPPDVSRERQDDVGVGSHPPNPPGVDPQVPMADQSRSLELVGHYRCGDTLPPVQYAASTVNIAIQSGCPRTSAQRYGITQETRPIIPGMFDTLLECLWKRSPGPLMDWVKLKLKLDVIPHWVELAVGAIAAAFGKWLSRGRFLVKLLSMAISIGSFLLWFWRRNNVIKVVDYTEKEVIVHEEIKVVVSSESIYNSPEDDHNHNVDPELVDLHVSSVVTEHKNGLIDSRQRDIYPRVSAVLVRSLLQRFPPAADFQSRFPILSTMALSASLRLRMPGKMASAVNQKIIEDSIFLANCIGTSAELSLRDAGF